MAFILGRKLRTFTQLRRNKRFDNFIMLVWVQGSPFHIAAGSHPVQEAWGSQDSLYRGQIQKFKYHTCHAARLFNLRVGLIHVEHAFTA